MFSLSGQLIVMKKWLTGSVLAYRERWGRSWGFEAQLNGWIYGFDYKLTHSVPELYLSHLDIIVFVSIKLRALVWPQKDYWEVRNISWHPGSNSSVGPCSVKLPVLKLRPQNLAFLEMSMCRHVVVINTRCRVLDLITFQHMLNFIHTK